MELERFDLQFFGEEEDGDEVGDSANNGEEQENIDIPEETPEEQAMKETLDQIEEELEASEAKVSELEEKMQALTEAVKSIMDILSLTSESVSAEQQNNKKIGELEAKIESLQASLDSVIEERDSLLDQVTEFETQFLKSLAEQIVDLKVKLGDITEESRQVELDRLSNKTEEVLLFVKEDLELRMSQSESSVSSTNIHKVTNPGLVENKETNVIEVDNGDGEGQESSSEKVELTPTEIYKALLIGERSLRKKQ